MRRPDPGLAVGVAGVAAATAGVPAALGALELAGQQHPDIWSNAWLVGAIFIAGVGLLSSVVIFMLDFLGRPAGDAEPSGQMRADDRSDRSDSAMSLPSVSQPEAAAVAQPGRSGIIAVSVLILVGAATNTMAFQSTLHLVLPGELNALTLVMAAGITCMAFAVAGNLGMAFADRQRINTVYASFAVFIAAIAWIAIGMAMFLARVLSADPNKNDFGIGLLPEPPSRLLEALFFFVIYLASGIYVIFQAQNIRNSRQAQTRSGSYFSHSRRVGSIVAMLLIVVIVVTDATAFQDVISLLLDDSELLVWLMAAGVTIITLGIAEGFAVALAYRRRGGTGVPFEMLAIAGVWLALGVTMFSALWEMPVPAFRVSIASNSSSATLIVIIFGTIYLVSGVCIIFQAEQWPRFSYRTLGPSSDANPGRIDEADDKKKPDDLALPVDEVAPKLVVTEGPSLVLAIETDLWEKWQNLTYIVALRIKITNATEEIIKIGSIGLGSDWVDGHSGESPALSAQERDELEREITAMQRYRYSPELRAYASAPPRESIVGWIVAEVPCRFKGGTPRLTVRVSDIFSNQYLAVVDGKDPKIFRS